MTVVETRTNTRSITPEEGEEVWRELGVSHVTLKMVGCMDWKLTDDPNLVLRHLGKGAELAGMTVVGQHFYKFTPQGLTACIFLAESHVDCRITRVYFHGWPEKTLSVMIDVCACRPKKLKACIDYYLKVFSPSWFRLENNEHKG